MFILLRRRWKLRIICIRFSGIQLFYSLFSVLLSYCSWRLSKLSGRLIWLRCQVSLWPFLCLARHHWAFDFFLQWELLSLLPTPDPPPSPETPAYAICLVFPVLSPITAFPVLLTPKLRFFFFFGPCCMAQDLSPPTRDWAELRQGKCGILTTGCKNIL